MNNSESAAFRSTAVSSIEKQTRLRDIADNAKKRNERLTGGIPVSANNVSNKKDTKTMAQDPKNQSSKSAPTPGTNKAPTATSATPATNGSAKTATTAPTGGSDAAKPEKKKNKRPRLRWVSAKDPSFWVRSYKDVTDKHGAPKDPWGGDMVVRAGQAFGAPRDPAAKAARLAAKEAEAKRLASMTDAEKLAFAKEKREQKQAAKAAKVAAEREAMVAQIKADIAAGRL